MKFTPEIEVELMFREDDLTELGIRISSKDGKDLQGQDIVEAVAECLLINWQVYDLESSPNLDS